MVGHSIERITGYTGPSKIKSFCDGRLIVVNSGIGTDAYSTLTIENNNYAFRNFFLPNRPGHIMKNQLISLLQHDTDTGSIDIHSSPLDI